MYAHTIGEKYDTTRDLDVALVAKLIRKDIKVAADAGKIPALATKKHPDGMKVSVTIDRYSMGQAISVNVAVPGPDRVPGTNPLSCKYGDHDAEDFDYTATTEQVEVSRAIHEIVDSYNYNNSDVMTDYFESKYCGLVSVRGMVEVARA